MYGGTDPVLWQVLPVNTGLVEVVVDFLVILSCMTASAVKFDGLYHPRNSFAIVL
jgi:hypothetical protein